MPGFRPAGIYEAGGIDNIGIYNGDPHIVVPLGPSYSLGPGQAWQLSAYYSAKFWHLDNPTRSCTTGGTSYPHARISGYPTLGAGWTLELGYVFAPAADNPANGVVYVAPDGSRHGVVLPSGTPSAITNDGSRLRIARTPTTGTITSYTVEFPDGTKQLFDHGYYAPSNVSAPDFADQNYTDATPAPLRRGLHTLTDAEGSTLLNVTYVSNITSSADAWKVDQIAIAAHTRKIIFTWGTAQVTDANNGNPTWPVLSSISFPSSGGGTQSVSFSFYGGTDSTVYPWPRNSYDEGPLTGTCKSPSTVAVPLLSAISDGTRLPYTFAYLKTTPDYTSRARALSDATLPETGTIHYDYDSFTPCFAECDDPETVAATVGLLAVPEPDPPPNCNLSNFLAKTPFVVARTTTDPVSNVSSRTTYDRYQYGPLVDLATCEFDESNVARSVLVTSYSGNGTGTVATRYLFHGESQSGSADGLELARRYYDEGADVSTATPFRSVINCWLGDSLPTTPICGLKSSAGATEPQAFPVLGSNVRQQAAVTWYGANPYPGGTCTGTSPTCLSTTNAITSWNATARRWATSTLNSTLSSWTTADSRDTTRVLVPQSTTKWLLDLFTDETITDSGPHATAPTTTKTTHAFNITTGFLESATTADATYGTLTRTFTDDGDGNPATIVTAGSGGLTGSFTDTLTFADGLVRTVQRSGLTVAWESLDVSRDLDTGLVTTSRDPHDLATTLHYDGLGRTIDVTPAGEGVETACYKNPSGGFPAWIILRKGSTTGASCITDDGAAPSGGWANTQEVVQYDGFGRVIREVRRRPTLAGTYFVRRETRYDNAGHRAYVSEWAPCPLITTPPPAKTTTDITNCLHPVPITPNPGTGTTWSDFDPLGRPRRVQIADGKTRDILYTDGSILHSDSYQKITVNGVGGTNPITYFRSDALGRTTSVQEPSVSGSADTTTYAYNIFDQVASVTQTRGGTTQTRSFTFDKLGLLRSETEPEGGTAAYTYDALGNPTSKTHGGVTYTMTYDQAGRLKIASADAHPTGTTYLMNCYDGTGNPCPDGTTANSNGGGSIFKGRLTKTVATNYIPTIASQVTHDYQYFASSGRVAADVTKIGNGDLSSTFTQSWTYSTLGQVATHNHPRASGTWQEVNSYSSGFPTKIVANGQTVAQNVTFNPASGISSWKAGNNVTTTIAQDSSFLPRPSSIATSGSTGGSFSSGAYAYDGAGNITGIGPDSFTYDARSRLKTATLSGQPQRIFSYDGFNNLTQNGSLTIGINAANNRITSGSALYDLGGNLTSYNSESMTFDAFNRLANKVSTAGNWTYLYDSGGERVVKFPNTSVLRREMARYISEANIIAKGWTLPAACPSAFPGDVNCTTDPDAAYIKLLSTQGVTSGCGGTNFCPNLALTRGEMAKFLGKGYHANGFTPPACYGNDVFGRELLRPVRRLDRRDRTGPGDLGLWRRQLLLGQPDRRVGNAGIPRQGQTSGHRTLRLDGLSPGPPRFHLHLARRKQPRGNRSHWRRHTSRPAGLSNHPDRPGQRLPGQHARRLLRHRLFLRHCRLAVLRLRPPGHAEARDQLQRRDRRDTKVLALRRGSHRADVDAVHEIRGNGAGHGV
jgi:YD repeat-containing protein